ncbi:MAG TPA: DotU family type IV/VI secretion system protein [Bryobacteraceae bacterium]|jgi:type VI secretion system protein ImpK|nr:DotU family type IV/VI secretion system protein [Bryobacteraceae bacterium]
MPVSTGGRTDNLALYFQEILTATVRLRSNRQVANDAEAFRQHIRDALRTAAQGANSVGGYSTDYVKRATLAVVAFLDESVLNAQNPLFANWPRKPLQEELFGTHMAGETFFQNLQELLAGDDSVDLADLLEVHYLCLLLGYRGRYSASGGGELPALMQQIANKIRRIRGAFSGLAPGWILQAETVRAAKDAWTRRLVIIAAACLVVAVLLFIVFKVSLGSGAAQIQSTASQVRN